MKKSKPTNAQVDPNANRAEAVFERMTYIRNGREIRLTVALEGEPETPGVYLVENSLNERFWSKFDGKDWYAGFAHVDAAAVSGMDAPFPRKRYWALAEEPK